MEELFFLYPEKTYLSTLNVNSAGAETLLIPLAVGQKIRVYMVFLNSHANQEVTFRRTGPAPLFGQVALGSRGGMALDFKGFAYFETLAGEGLEIVLAQAAQTSGFLKYTKAP